MFRFSLLDYLNSENSTWVCIWMIKTLKVISISCFVKLEIFCQDLIPGRSKLLGCPFEESEPSLGLSDLNIKIWK